MVGWQNPNHTIRQSKRPPSHGFVLSCTFLLFLDPEPLVSASFFCPRGDNLQSLRVPRVPHCAAFGSPICVSLTASLRFSLEVNCGIILLSLLEVGYDTPSPDAQPVPGVRRGHSRRLPSIPLATRPTSPKGWGGGEAAVVPHSSQLVPSLVRVCHYPNQSFETRPAVFFPSPPFLLPCFLLPSGGATSPPAPLRLYNRLPAPSLARYSPTTIPPPSPPLPNPYRITRFTG